MHYLPGKKAKKNYEAKEKKSIQRIEKRLQTLKMSEKNINVLWHGINYDAVNVLSAPPFSSQ